MSCVSRHRFIDQRRTGLVINNTDFKDVNHACRLVILLFFPN